MSDAAPTLLFATIEAGGGHVASAKAMAQAIEAEYPGRFRVEISDFMAEVGVRSPAVAAFDRRHKALWRRALQRPWSTRMGQRLIDLSPRLTQRALRLTLGSFAEAAADLLGERGPALVVSNHGLLSVGLSLARRRHGLDVPVLTYATETHNISAYWADPEAARILVPNAGVGSRLTRMGVPADRIEVVGYPVQRAFLCPRRQSDARRALHLPERSTILVSLGGEGLGGGPVALVDALRSGLPAAQILVVCGRNAELEARLRARDDDRIRALGFTDAMPDLLAACDVVVGKAGPASVHEALASLRPVFATSFAGLNELGVVRMLERERLGAYLPDVGRLVAALRRLLTRPDELAEIAARCRALDLPGQTVRTARSIAAFLGSSV